MAPISIEIACRQNGLWPVDRKRLRQAVRQILQDAGLAAGMVSIAVVDDRTIQRLNRKFLGHDDPTDVLSFVLERREGWLEGEIVASAETARRVAPDMGCDADDELLLYVIHGALHLVGYDDTTDASAAAMRDREGHYLSLLAESVEHDSTDQLVGVAFSHSLELKDA